MNQLQEWQKISSFCAIFLEACKVRKLDKKATQEEILKSAAADKETAQEWLKFFKQV